MSFPITRDEITKNEAGLNVIFPNDYKDILCSSNCGSFQTDEDDWQLFPLKDTTDDKRLSRTSINVPYNCNTAKNGPNLLII
jgi:hypothetical protein